MTHPTKAQVQTVIDNLTRILPEAEREEWHLDMGEPAVCGTTMCHAGWYLISVHGKDPNTSYLDGTQLMAEHLGFADEEELEVWASGNPGIWGNDIGSGIFCDRNAFTPHGKTRADTLRDIVDHWTEVRDRLPE